MLDSTMCVWLDSKIFGELEIKDCSSQWDKTSDFSDRRGLLLVRSKGSNTSLYFSVQTKEDAKELAALLKRLSVPVGEREEVK